jgi:hypothetical protein
MERGHHRETVCEPFATPVVRLPPYGPTAPRRSEQGGGASGVVARFAAQIAPVSTEATWAEWLARFVVDPNALCGAALGMSAAVLEGTQTLRVYRRVWVEAAVRRRLTRLAHGTASIRGTPSEPHPTHSHESPTPPSSRLAT